MDAKKGLFKKLVLRQKSRGIIADSFTAGQFDQLVKRNLRIPVRAFQL